MKKSTSLTIDLTEDKDFFPNSESDLLSETESESESESKSDEPTIEELEYFDNVKSLLVNEIIRELGSSEISNIEEYNFLNKMLLEITGETNPSLVFNSRLKEILYIYDNLRQKQFLSVHNFLYILTKARNYKEVFDNLLGEKSIFNFFIIRQFSESDVLKSLIKHDVVSKIKIIIEHDFGYIFRLGLNNKNIIKILDAPKSSFELVAKNVHAIASRVHSREEVMQLFKSAYDLRYFIAEINNLTLPPKARHSSESKYISSYSNNNLARRYLGSRANRLKRISGIYNLGLNPKISKLSTKQTASSSSSSTDDILDFSSKKPGFGFFDI